MLLSRENGAFVIDNPAAVQFLGLLIPRSRLSPLLPNLDDSIRTMRLEATDPLKLLGKYLGVLMDEPIALTQDLQERVADHVYDIVAAAIGATRDAVAVVERGGIRAARLRAIQSYISAHLHGPDLSVSAVAACFKVTPRYIHKLFESEGASFSEYVLAQRLERAYRMLTGPRSADRPISSIAYEVGFGDLSYFNRVFRRSYNASPREVRKALKAE